ncbi:SdpI family protein [Laceyella putida]|uniref:SdpI family protein n=1 Tax=Laceyella putida TaxID=110101 RepID=A0ABW2RNC4_9BACL
MKHLHKPYLILAWIIAIMTLGIFLYVYGNLPERVPIHWNIKGEIDNYGSKNMLWLLGILPLAMILLLTFLPNWDPRREKYASHGKAYSILMLYVTLIMSGAFLGILALTLGYRLDMTVVLQLLIGILFTAIGNYLPQVRQTFFFGIRTPWTLTSEDNWRKTHRFGSKVFVAIGLIMIASVFLPIAQRAVLPFAAIIIGLVLTYWYSYREYKKNKS